jgi:DNA-binding MarR family transcriptional regulator
MHTSGAEMILEQGMPAVRTKGGQRPRKTGAGDSMPLSAPNLCHGTALRKATRRVSQLYDAVLAPCGLRSTQRLTHVARAGSPTMGDLAAALVLDRSALARNIKPLERDRLVAVVVDAKDRRSRVVTLTKRGESKLQESTTLWHGAQARFEAVFGAGKAGT